MSKNVNEKDAERCQNVNKKDVERRQKMSLKKEKSNDVKNINQKDDKKY